MVKIFEVVDNKRQYRVGMCDIFAIALHNLTDLPFGAWGGKYYDEYTEEDEWEYCHLCVVLDFQTPKWADVDGVHSGKPQNCYFNNPVENIELVRVSRQEAEEMFTACPIDDSSIKQAEDHIKSDPELSRLVK